MILQVDSLCKRLGNTEVLKNLSFELAQNEILGVIGPSGGGKTTLLRCMDILELINSGQITYHFEFSHEISAESNLSDAEACKIRKKIGFVFQGFNLWEEKTILDNLVLAPRVVLGLPRSQLESDAHDLCDHFGLKEKLHARAWELSGGQRQRVALIRSIMMQPKLLLLDEVTSALDPVLTVEVMEFVRDLKLNGMSMIIVTHHIEFASSLCDRIMFLSGGKIIQIDTPANILQSPVNEAVHQFIAILRKAR